MGKQNIAIIDYGSGNIRSAAKAFEHILGDNGTVTVTADAETVRAADKIVLPGQGAFGDCMAGLRAVDGMIDMLHERVLKGGVPFFGICVGMQLLADKGHEFGTHDGLGWIGGAVRKMTPSDPSLKIPHMGWNEVFAGGAIHPVLHSVTQKSDRTFSDFYFVHSFVFDCKDEENVAGWCDYGGRFAAIVAKDNIFGTQFHPEKSQQAGLDLVRGFLDWNP